MTNVRIRRTQRMRALLGVLLTVWLCAAQALEGSGGDKRWKAAPQVALAGPSPIIQASSSGARADHAQRPSSAAACIPAPVDQRSTNWRFLRPVRGTRLHVNPAAGVPGGRSPPITVS